MDSTRLVQIRKDFYLNIKKRVEAILGQETSELKSYRDTYDKELGKLSWQAVDKRHLFSRLKTAEIIMVGDFHVQKQSTRGFLRVIRKIKTPIILALECLTSKDQPAIDEYLSGQLTATNSSRAAGVFESPGVTDGFDDSARFRQPTALASGASGR